MEGRVEWCINVHAHKLVLQTYHAKFMALSMQVRLFKSIIRGLSVKVWVTKARGRVLHNDHDNIITSVGMGTHGPEVVLNKFSKGIVNLLTSIGIRPVTRTNQLQDLKNMKS